MQKSQKKEGNNSTTISQGHKDRIAKMRKSQEEDNSLTEELLQEKYKGLNLDWD